ncbi:hypothetical protein M409DRAFT_67710 [Zasmidium cellare ATCC 36951]|uniref:COP9 signalosome complex subunit 6 n=1 Tax=Zasmidium cellare ATCC 36951 TaxID=1080233 RepID=A0A6A6CF62_ZASCE|nr:uncharacterized protein M409DRAFT_67710 [Zasmidium cellare ATCC 36951]KAF2164562.1 hypothetical protein M409DRAFT_67710 [Zasmidium cellare ATCC 36951]
MAGKATSSNPLVVTGKAPDTSLNVQLHPLVLLTISDYITRHTLRSQPGPIIGAVIGEQSGRNFTLEHAYQCKLAEKPTGDAILDGQWFEERLEMYKEVHKVPALDLVAVFALGPIEGPQEAHLPVLRQVRELTGSDNIMLLLFHPELVDSLQGGKLPISLYESVEELENDQVQVRFRELAFEVETGDAERIGVNFVATGGGNATAVAKPDNASSIAVASASSSKDKKGKGKAKAKEGEEGETNGAAPINFLSPEDDELISTLNSKVNAIKMLGERLDLIRSYLETLPQSYLTDATSTAAPAETTNFQLLRSVQSMLSRLPLLAPPDSAPENTDPGAEPPANLELAAEKERQDVHLTSLLASLTRSVAEAQTLGSKFTILQRERQTKERSQFGRGPPMRGGFNDDLLADNGAL